MRAREVRRLGEESEATMIEFVETLFELGKLMLEVVILPARIVVAIAGW